MAFVDGETVIFIGFLCQVSYMIEKPSHENKPFASGDTREVYFLESRSDMVLKAGDNGANLCEYKAWSQVIHGSEVESEFARITRSADDYSWILMEYVNVDKGCSEDIDRELLRRNGLRPGRIKDENVGINSDGETVIIDYPWAHP